MQAIIDQVLDAARGAWRFRWQAMIAAWLVCLFGWGAVLAMRDVYEASARVFVDTRTALTPVIQGLAIGQDVNAQLNFVQQSLMGGPQLEKVARAANFTPSEPTPQARAALIAGLRERLMLTAAGPARGESGGTVYTISFQDEDRRRTLKVVQTLLDAFVEDTLGGKRTGSAAAQKFLQEQIQENERRLRESEQRLADFKRRNVGLMPGAGGDYFTRLQGEIEADKKAQAQLSILLTRRGEIERQLRGETPFASSASAPGGAVPDAAARIKDTQSKLDDLLLRFTEKHPDVIALRETLEELQRRRTADIDAFRRGDPSALARSGGATNPVFQNIQLALNQVDVEIAELRRELSDRQAKIGELRRLIDTAPEVEAEFSRLNRDYDVTRAQYAALVERLGKARLGEEAESTGSVRFEVIDPPSAAFMPVAPNRLYLVALVLFAGLLAGGGIALLLNQLKPVFANSRVLSEVTGLPVLGVVSMTWLSRHQGEHRKEYVIYAGMAVTLLLAFVLTALFNAAGAQFIRQILGPAGTA